MLCPLLSPLTLFYLHKEDAKGRTVSLTFRKRASLIYSLFCVSTLVYGTLFDYYVISTRLRLFEVITLITVILLFWYVI